MANKHGSLSIDSDNLFPIIKKWLYSDHDIFYRELISNGCDAITKLKKLDMMGEYTLPADFKAKISVTVDPEAIGVGIIYFIIYVICGGFVCPQELSEHLKLSRRTLQEYRKPIIDGKIRDGRYT